MTNFGDTSDRRVALNAQIARQAAMGEPCVLGPGTFYISGGHLVAQGHIVGAGPGKTTIVQQSTNQAVIRVDTQSDWSISDLSIVSDTGATNYRSLQVYGEGTWGKVHRVQITNGGLYVDGGGASYAPGVATTNGLVSQMVIDTVSVDDSPEYGIFLASCQGIDVIGAQIRNCTIDGLKLSHACDDVTVTGGYATLCGQEGLDAFMGGRHLTIVGFKAFDNTGGGIIVKSDDNIYDAGNFQPQEQITIVGVICRGNGTQGLAIDRNGSVDDPLIPLMAHVLVHGGSFTENTVGIKVRARNVSLVGVSCRRNLQRGISFEPEAIDCVAIAPQVQANSQQTVNTYDGIHINGIRNGVIGGYSIGSDDVELLADAGYSGLVAQQRYGAIIINGSTDCYAYDVVAHGNGTGDVVSGDTDGIIRTRTRIDIVDAGGTRRSLSVDATGDLLIGATVVGTQS